MILEKPKRRIDFKIGELLNGLPDRHTHKATDGLPKSNIVHSEAVGDFL